MLVEAQALVIAQLELNWREVQAILFSNVRPVPTPTIQICSFVERIGMSIHVKMHPLLKRCVPQKFYKTPVP